MALVNSLATLLYLIMSFGLLFLSGYGVTRLCLREESDGIRWIITPIVGLAVWILLIENLGIMGLGTNRGAPLALLAVTASTLGVRLMTRSTDPKLGESTRHVWVVTGVCLFFVNWPMLILSHKDYIGFANPDAWLYFSMADYFQHHSYWELPFSTMDISYHPILALAKSFQTIHHRVGEAYWVSSVAFLLGSDTKEMYQIVHGTAYLLIPLSVYAFCRRGLGLDERQSLLAALLQGINAVLALLYFQQLLPHIMGLTILPLILGMGAQLVHSQRTGQAVLLGLLAAALFTIYPELFLFAAIPLGAYLMVAWRTLNRRNILRMTILLIVTTVALNPVFWVHGFGFLQHQLSATAGGRTYFYAFQPIIFPIYWGLTSSPLLYANLLPSPMLMAHLAIVFPLAFGLLCVTVFGIQRLSRLQDKAFPTYLIAYALMGVGFLLMKGRYTYGFFKFLSYTQFLVLTAFVAGLAGLWRMGHANPLRRIWKLMAAALGLGYLGFNLVSILTFGFASSQQSVSLGLRNVIALPSNQAYHQLLGIRSMIPPEESVMVDVVSLVPQLYLSYYLRDIRISFPQASSYLANLYRNPVSLHHSFKDQYLLKVQDASRDVVVNHIPEPLWKNESFVLSRFPQPYVSLVITNPFADVNTNWYTLEYDSQLRQPFRWVNNDAMIRIIGQHGSRLRLVADLEPPPWDTVPNRTIDVFVNGVLLQTVSITGRTQLVSLPFILTKADTEVRLNIREETKDVPINNHLSRFLLGDARDIRRLNLKVYRIGAQPVVSQLEAFEDTIQCLPGVVTTNQIGQRTPRQPWEQDPKGDWLFC